MATQNSGIPRMPPQSIAPVSEAQRLTLQQEQRLVLLKQQKEFERKEKERALWREASKMSTLTENKSQPASNAPKTVLQPTRPVMGFFAKLKLGKFLE